MEIISKGNENTVSGEVTEDNCKDGKNIINDALINGVAWLIPTFGENIEIIIKIDK